MDHHLGRLFDALRALGRFDDAWIVITADHGELLGEHGLVGHGNALYEELIRIPLIVKAPGADPPSGRSDSPAQSVDVFATILDALGLDAPSGIQGQPLGRVDRPLVSELSRLEFMEGRMQPGAVWRGDQRVLYDGRFKLIWSGVGLHQLFDVIADPREQEDRSASDADVVASMQEQLRAYLATLPEPGPDERDPRRVDAETEASLRELGYLE
jgi:arylsulfatase A-like enzyme